MKIYSESRLIVNECICTTHMTTKYYKIKYKLWVFFFFFPPENQSCNSFEAKKKKTHGYELINKLISIKLRYRWRWRIHWFQSAKRRASLLVPILWEPKRSRSRSIWRSPIQSHAWSECWPQFHRSPNTDQKIDQDKTNRLLLRK